MWWLAALFTGARKGSIEALKWADLDLEKKTIHFRVTKGDRPYAVPMCDKLAEFLTEYRDGGDVRPSPWVFPSSAREGDHIVGVKNDKEGVGPAHRLRHTFRTTLAQLGASPDQARMLMGHSMGGDVSRGYITAPLVVESLRNVTNAVAEYYLKFVNLEPRGWLDAQGRNPARFRKFENLYRLVGAFEDFNWTTFFYRAEELDGKGIAKLDRVCVPVGRRRRVGTVLRRCDRAHVEAVSLPRFSQGEFWIAVYRARLLPQQDFSIHLAGDPVRRFCTKMRS